MLLESLLDSLAARQKDSSASVRRLVLRGLANIASGSPDKVGPVANLAGYPHYPVRAAGRKADMEVEGGRYMGPLLPAATRRTVTCRTGLDEWNSLSTLFSQVRAHSSQLLTAMISGLDDGDDPHSLVALEAMVGLARLLDLVEPRDLRSVLLHTAIRIRPFFDSVGFEGGLGGHHLKTRHSSLAKLRAIPRSHELYFCQILRPGV
jgi:hypothetical protein